MITVTVMGLLYPLKFALFLGCILQNVCANWLSLDGNSTVLQQHVSLLQFFCYILILYFCNYEAIIGQISKTFLFFLYILI